MNSNGKFWFVNLWIILTSVVTAWGGNNTWSCFRDGGEKGVLDRFTVEAVPLETLTTHFPDVKFTQISASPPRYDGKLRVFWKPLSEGMSLDSFVIMTYHGHDVRCFKYKEKPEPGMPEWWFDLAVLAYEEQTDKEQMFFRPFLILDGECIRDFNPELDSTKAHRNSIKIEEMVDGNGAQGKEWIVELTKEGPQIKEYTTYGRKMPTVTYYYNSAGKITKVDKEED